MLQDRVNTFHLSLKTDKSLIIKNEQDVQTCTSIAVTWISSDESLSSLSHTNICKLLIRQ